jgi:hypothetical protein
MRTGHWPAEKNQQSNRIQKGASSNRTSKEFEQNRFLESSLHETGSMGESRLCR